MMHTSTTSPEGTICTRVRSADVRFIARRLLSPLQLSTGVIGEITEASVEVEVEVGRNQICGRGRGSIYLSDLWAWPDPAIDHERRDAALRQICEKVAVELPRLFSTHSLHPLEMGLRLHQWTCHELEAPCNPPTLARAMCCSPFDAAIHDAVGQATGLSAFRFYDAPVELPAADPFFPNGGAAAAIRRLIQKPRSSFPAWLLVGKDELLKDALAKAVEERGYYCFKIKISGQDTRRDVDRTVEIFRQAKALGADNTQISVDSNESNPDAESVWEYLEQLESRDREALRALQYIEQPTGRNIDEHAYDWRRVAKQKPVLLDEGLADLSSLETARAQGWNGLALKTCKGHSMLLAAAAWGHEHGMLLSLQDLTNPGVSLIHAALVAAYLPTVNGAELNSPQFTPSANKEFLPRLSQLFEPQHGVHVLPTVSPPGLGSAL